MVRSDRIVPALIGDVGFMVRRVLCTLKNDDMKERK